MRTLRPLLVALFVVLAPAAAQAAPEDVANAVAREVMSPYCPGVTLHECPSSSAREMRATIGEWVEDGMSKEAILARLEDEFDASIRAVPRAEGAGLFAWLLPGVAVLVGGVVAVALARRWAHRPPAPAEAPAPVPAEAAARLRAELDRLRSES